MSYARVRLQFAALLPLMMAASALAAQNAPVEIPAATPLPVQLGQHVPMKKGEPLECHLLYPVYAGNQLAIPAGSVVRGTVVALNPDRSERIHARLWGDFTPFHIPVVHFDQIVLSDGTVQQIVSDNATDGAPVMHLSPPESGPPRSLIGQEIDQLKKSAKRTIALVTTPGRTDRLVQMFYKQLPYHPERIESATLWTATLAQPLTLTSDEVPRNTNSDSAAAVPTSGKPTQTDPDDKSAWRIRAYLAQTISSATEKPGNTFEAVVAEPVFNPDHTLVIPQGSLLIGTITKAAPSRSFARGGKLRFDFRELRLPGAPPQHVQGALSAVNASKSQPLQIDSEGGMQPEAKNRVIVPLVLTLLAGRALDDDGNAVGNAAIGSNGFGMIGRVIGMAGGSRGLAAGIGFYGAGLSFYERWLVHGKDVSFVKNTRIEVTTIPSGNPFPATESQPSAVEKH